MLLKIMCSEAYLGITPGTVRVEQIATDASVLQDQDMQLWIDDYEKDADILELYATWRKSPWVRYSYLGAREGTPEADIEWWMPLEEFVAHTIRY